MRASRYLLPTLREAPSDADNVSAALMQRAGLVRKLAAGLYEWLPLGLRAFRKVEAIVREEMDSAGCLEVSLPVIQPRELWDETGRWRIYGKELLRLRDRKGGEFCFAPTAEEVITDLARREVRSWRQLPLALYQFGLKFRDEIRPRFGVMRSREFVMKDAYSFHAGEEDCERFYHVMVAAYTRIFERCGLRFRAVEADSGAIGGSFSHEFMVLAETGEEGVLSCTACRYAANIERAECAWEGPEPTEEPRPPEEVPTPGATGVAEVGQLLGAPPEAFLKTQLYLADGRPVMALVRGDHELGERKLARALGCGNLERASQETYERIAGCPVGFAGPARLPRWKTPEGQMIEVRIVADLAVQGMRNAVSGANKDGYHLRNLNPGRDFPLERHADIRAARPEDPCPRCRGPMRLDRGIEVGHTFKLGTKYSESLKATYLDAEQKPRPLVMGCYGIGVGRTVAAAVEQGHDEAGIIWPAAIAPFQACVVPVEHDLPAVREAAERLTRELSALGVDALLDDRPERPGVRFKDADLIGFPLRLVVSAKTLQASEAEAKRRAGGPLERWPLAGAAARARDALRS